MKKCILISVNELLYTIDALLSTDENKMFSSEKECMSFRRYIKSYYDSDKIHTWYNITDIINQKHNKIIKDLILNNGVYGVIISNNC